MGNQWKVRGWEITDDDINIIQKLTKEHFRKGRKEISRQICGHWQWYQANGQPKERACREILLFLEKQKLIELPSPLRPANNDKQNTQRLQLQEIPLTGTVKKYPSLKITLLNTRREYKLWNRIVGSYHYQRHQGTVAKCNNP